MPNVAPTPLMDQTLTPGNRVEIRSTLDRGWKRGFEIAELVDDGYRVRRLSDNSVLPVVFGVDDVRRERRRDTWWY